MSDRRVGEQVAELLGLDQSPEAIAGSLSASAGEDSSQITVSASAGTPTEARDLANAAVSPSAR